MPTICPIRFEKLTGVKKFCAVKPNAMTTMRSAPMTGALPRLPVRTFVQNRCGVALLLDLGGDGRSVRAHAFDLPSAVPGIPETFVGMPAVIACTISSCVVFSRS